MKNFLTAAAFALFACAAQSAEPFSLKGYELRQNFTCATPVKKSEAKEFCDAGETTYAGYRAQLLVVTYRGKIAGLMARLPQGSSGAYAEIREALREKYGPATDAKPHVNSYIWRSGRDALSFDGWKGLVLIADTAADALAKEEAGKAAARDM